MRLKLFIPIICFVVLSGFLYFGLGNDPTKLPSVLIGKPLPEFNLPTLESNLEQAQSSSDLLGSVFLINIWATWCPSCLTEHPYLYELSEQGVNIVGVNYKDEASKANEWLKKYKNPYSVTVFDENGRLGFDLGVSGAPETFVVNAAGEVVYRHVGTVTKENWKTIFEPFFE